VPWSRSTRNSPRFEVTSKRRKGFPSETQVRRGDRVVHGNKELAEKLGRNDPCLCGSTKAFKRCCLKSGRFRRRQSRPLSALSLREVRADVHERRAARLPEDRA